MSMNEQDRLIDLKKELALDHGGDLERVAAVLGVKVDDILDLSTNVNPFGPPSMVRAAAVQSLYHMDRYPDPKAAELQEEIARMSGVPVQRTVVGPGAVELICRSFKCLKSLLREEQDEVIIPVPTFLEYSRAAAAIGFRVKEIPLERKRGFALPQDLDAAVGPQTAAVVLCRPNNPTGRMISDDELAPVLDACLSNDAFLLVDECFSDLVEPSTDRSLLQELCAAREGRPLILLRSFTKTYAIPGLRLGYLLTAHEGLAQVLRSAAPPWSINSIAQAAGLASLHLPQTASDLRDHLREERPRLAAGLKELGLTEVMGEANYLFFSAPGEPLLREKLLLEKPPILIRSCANYPGLTPYDYRVSVLTREADDRLLSALERVLSTTERDEAPEKRQRDPEKGSRAHSIMVLGTTSNAGKSFVVAGLCRLFKRLGYRVAPFKAQNMALNSAITPEGLEIGRAQAMQAEACGIAPEADMNPVLLKPTSRTGSQVIVRGEVWKDLSAKDYYRNKGQLWPQVKASFDSLSRRFDVIVVEGAGSPAEINLREGDFVNAGLATRLGIPCLLVGDIDRGGVFASLFGTVALLTDAERERIKGLVINKFRGDRSILEPGERQIEALTGIPVAGCLPMADIRLDDEDSLSSVLEPSAPPPLPPGGTDIAVIRLPRLSNFTDLNVFEHHPRVRLRYVSSPRELGSPHLIILPGTKSTVEDLLWLRSSGLEGKILRAWEEGCPIFGICGGYQMLGQSLSDPEGVEQEAGSVHRGMGLLAAETIFAPVKQRRLTQGSWEGTRVTGYEIHMGRTTGVEGKTRPLLQLDDGGTDGLCDETGTVCGTYLHGCLDAPGVVEKLLERLHAHWVARRKAEAGGATDPVTASVEGAQGFVTGSLETESRGSGPAMTEEVFDLEAFKEGEYERLADLMEKNMDVDLLLKIVGLPPRPKMRTEVD